MISYLADGVLMIALIVTSIWVMKMNTRLQKLRDNQFEFRRIMEQTNLALNGIEVSIDEINVRGKQVLNALGSRIDEARDIVTDIDRMTREVRKQQKELRLEMVAFQDEIGKECANQVDLLKRVSDAADRAISPNGNASEPHFQRLENQLPQMLRKVRLKS
ncbi:hypothetical protein [Cohaesibacter celericrescens]|uniref:Uncharacterized protein n=1 Tax=Cohaesibacter celericrescens TaxID=2067669 RepID=A0A2N5XM44_9HYPH|nr:hypothetical protein [Cohaesibacter celericrescens]PLW75500.1 hypothetical protein C0081_19365 [Cohaesibacter celericrescens]PLW78907.1 hypothetical protein C0081_01325 [Cohaesibacter celericrescens]